MKDADCIAFLQWALPRLRLRWPGFRKVRGQVCKRIDRRCEALGLPDMAAYHLYLETHPAEWAILDILCHISISRFYRDRAVFDQLRQIVWPTLAERALAQGEHELRCWSLGCASGEEIYTLGLIWQLELRARFPGLTCRMLGTDAEEPLLQRARTGCYSASSLRELPQAWREAAFSYTDEAYCLRDKFRLGVEFQQQDIRLEQPEESFHLILCRNLIFTYFETSLQRQVLASIIQHLHPSGVLVIGKKEQLPEGAIDLVPWVLGLGIYRRDGET